MRKTFTFYQWGGTFLVLALFVLFTTTMVNAAAETWTETGSTIYQTDNSKNVGIGTTTPSYEIHGVSNQSTVDPFVFEGYDGAGSERDIFTIKSNDNIAAAQDESSYLKVWSTRTWDNNADGVSLVELTHNGTLPTVSDRQFYILGRTQNEGIINWGISITDSDFWTKGDINGGATGTDCGGTGAACFNSPTFHIAASGDSYINSGNFGIGTSSPAEALDVTGNIKASGTICDSTGCITGGGAAGTPSQWTTSGSNIYYDLGNVGIGTTTPTAGLQVASNSGLLATGTFSSGSIPTTGAGTRMMWYPGKAAFRAGYVTDTQWDDDNIGRYSVAMGRNNIASNDSSVALGEYNTASGNKAIAIGNNGIASGNGAISIGGANSASGDYSLASGINTYSTGTMTTSMGYNTTAQSYMSLAMGRYNVLSGDLYNWISTDPLFVIGNGSRDSSRNNALTVYKNGNAELDGSLTATGTICDSTGCIGGGGGGTSAWGISGSDIYYNSGHVGIGTTAPDSNYQLHVINDGSNQAIRAESTNNIAINAYSDTSNAIFATTNASSEGAIEALSYSSSGPAFEAINTRGGDAAWLTGDVTLDGNLSVTGDITSSGEICIGSGC